MPPEPGDEEEKRGCVLSWPSYQKEIVWLSFLRDSPRVVQTGGRRGGSGEGSEKKSGRAVESGGTAKRHEIYLFKTTQTCRCPR